MRRDTFQVLLPVNAATGQRRTDALPLVSVSSWSQWSVPSMPVE